ncbi:hypothetical protein D3C80_1963120 [compost metagenome]
MRVVFAQVNHFRDVIEQRWRLKLTVRFFAQMENGEARGHVLVIRCFAGDQIGCGFDNGFMNI